MHDVGGLVGTASLAAGGATEVLHKLGMVQQGRKR